MLPNKINVDIRESFIATLAEAWLIILPRTYSEPTLSSAHLEAT